MYCVGPHCSYPDRGVTVGKGIRLFRVGGGRGSDAELDEVSVRSPHPTGCHAQDSQDDELKVGIGTRTIDLSGPFQVSGPDGGRGLEGVTTYGELENEYESTSSPVLPDRFRLRETFNVYRQYETTKKGKTDRRQV